MGLAEVKRTSSSSKPGAETGIIIDVSLEALQSMVVTLRLPPKRPSTEKSPPRVWKDLFCIHQTGSRNIISIRNRSSRQIPIEKEINQ